MTIDEYLEYKIRVARSKKEKSIVRFVPIITECDDCGCRLDSSVDYFCPQCDGDVGSMDTRCFHGSNRCDSCGSRLYGPRFHASFLAAAREPVRSGSAVPAVAGSDIPGADTMYCICADCEYFDYYQHLDDSTMANIAASGYVSRNDTFGNFCRQYVELSRTINRNAIVPTDTFEKLIELLMLMSDSLREVNDGLLANFLRVMWDQRIVFRCFHLFSGPYADALHVGNTIKGYSLIGLGERPRGKGIPPSVMLEERSIPGFIVDESIPSILKLSSLDEAFAFVESYVRPKEDTANTTEAKQLRE
jgi:hypothetical protein